MLQDIDLNPRKGWSKPADALGLSNPLSHLPQSQQVQRLQEQIELHRQFQRSAQQISTKSKKSLSKSSSSNNNKGNSDQAKSQGNEPNTRDIPTSGSFQQTNDNQKNDTESRLSSSFGGFNARPRSGQGNNYALHRHSLHLGGGGHVQHINIQNDDDDDSYMSGDDPEQDLQHQQQLNRLSSSNSSSSSMRGMDIKMPFHNGNNSNDQGAFHHHRSMSHPHLTQGFAPGGIHGFTPFSPESPISPSSPGSFTSDNNSFSGFTSGLMNQQATGSNQSSGFHNNGGGIESSLASLAALSVMSSTPSSNLPNGAPRRSSNAGNTPNGFLPTQNLSGAYQNQTSQSNSLLAQSNMFTSALGQQLQRQQQQQQQQFQQPSQHQQQQQQGHTEESMSSYHQMSSASQFSSSLPAQSAISPFSQHQQQHLQNNYQHHHNSNYQPQFYDHQSAPQQQQQHHQPQIHDSQDDRERSRSKSASLVIPPATRAIPPRPPQTSAPRKYHGRQSRKAPPPITNVVKEVVAPTRRMAHILSEQKRREKINGGFDELKTVIPE